MRNILYICGQIKRIMVGRKQEYASLQRSFDSNKAEITVVYGRRRVGKTFLINEFFSNSYAFKHTAVSPVGRKKAGLMKIQLQEFFYSLKSYGLDSDIPCPTSWTEAFHLLQELLDKKYDGSKQVIFIDELPWMDTPRANFLSAFEHFCNDWCLARKYVKLIVCGSATSWIINRVIDSKGGLYGRVTSRIYVKPFTLKECREYFVSEGFRMDNYDIMLCYMAFGGIPYYLSQLRSDLSVAQNIDATLFDKEGSLADEFDRLFQSQFTNPDMLKEIVTLVGSKRCGLTRDEILRGIKQLSGGTFSDSLQALEKSRFISSYIPFGETEKKYRLSDLFCYFHLHHVKKNAGNKTYWQNNSNSAAMNSWLGLAFEEVVFSHIDQVKHALGISGVVTRESSWAVNGDDESPGMQIDLIIDRDDRVLNICEVKYSHKEFSVNGSYARVIDDRIEKISERIGGKGTIISVLITTYGLRHNEYSGRFPKVITMEDFFD